MCGHFSAQLADHCARTGKFCSYTTLAKLACGAFVDNTSASLRFVCVSGLAQGAERISFISSLALIGP